FRPELVSKLARPRLPELGVGSSISPMDALKAYLDNREDLKDISKDMLEAAHQLLASNGDSWLGEVESDIK
ncbi:MAG: exonuclease sbcCD subunit D, partial [Symploca sp. SIO2E9]|nr:exonuclease sbcCD subunit D [Symploca sp. SIO2E9]